MNRDQRKLFVAVSIVLLTFALSYFVSGYRLFQLSQIGIYFIAIVGLSLLTGFNGQISLGHSAFFAIGAYTTAILSQSMEMNALLTIPVASLVCLAAGYLIGLPATRLEGLYLALATFALAVATPQFLKYKPLEPLTGGVQGIYLVLPGAPEWVRDMLGVSDEQWLLLIVLLAAAVVYLAVINMASWKFGRAIVAIRDHPVAAAAMGVNVAGYKAAVFALSAACAGVAGALNAMVVQFVAPDSFTFYVSITFLVGMVVGGSRSLGGALLGAVFVQMVPNYAEQVSKSAPWAIYGALLVATIYLCPGGAAELGPRLVRALKERMRRVERIRWRAQQTSGKT